MDVGAQHEGEDVRSRLPGGTAQIIKKGDQEDRLTNHPWERSGQVITVCVQTVVSEEILP